MKKKAVVLLAMLFFSGVYAQEKVITVKYYYVEGCPYCEEVKAIINGIENDYPEIEIIRMNVYKSSVYMNDFLNYGFWKVPAVVINGKAKFQGDDEVTGQNLRETIDRYLAAYRKGNSFFETGKKYYNMGDYKKAEIYLEEAKKFFEIGNFSTNSTEEMLGKCNLCIESYDLIFKGDLFLENGEKEKAEEMYSQVKCDDLRDQAEERLKNLDNYDEAVKNFNTALKYYDQKDYSHALRIFEKIENILVNEKQTECNEYIEKCKRYMEAETLYNEGIDLIFDDPLSAYRNFINSMLIYESLGENTERCDKFADAALNFYTGKILYEKGSGSVLYFENAKKDFEYLGFEKGVEKSEYYIKKIRNRGLIYWISLIIIVSLISLTYLFIIRKRIGKKEKKKRKENKDTKKELKDLVEKYANGEISLEEFDRKKKKVMK